MDPLASTKKPAPCVATAQRTTPRCLEASRAVGSRDGAFRSALSLPPQPRPRRSSADAPEHEVAPFLPMPGIVRSVRLAPPTATSSVDPHRATELAALCDRAVESLRVGHSARGVEAHVRVRLRGARSPVEVHLASGPDGSVVAEIHASSADRGAASALADRVGDALAAQGTFGASVTVELS